MTNHIVLYQPEIPTNTGNIGRTCAGTDTTLHLIKPLGFSTDDKMLKRAGLDYWHNMDIRYYDNAEEFIEKTSGNYYMITKFAEKYHTEMDFSDAEENHYFVFGRETSGLPEWMKERYADTALRVPINDKIRSLNLANTAAILLFESLRQQGYPKLH
ncbi:tRNA (uridine(34)/cytosine(34)/5-carboxymethylaminomethyluridine(34)-2'-O)-methyltransferase TrmL [Salinicoccus albus]|uniref:tRNA (uridine(34)/cytosine(34)/5- carboxymethylaminomethyluridine(34)-2'-O)- methyltransferase TrmL n=1 Tax=Salinicoccus albus TaxID=418756 RepID=UPI0003628008|nr:tRNA (uridine(34)/cytosine(34)/5-carboxymethylaminomethyluridine(34)-2'-O)-methyltransferase TrmL [Salinicoccus albus]